MSFDNRHALIPIYQDDSKEIVILKCVQFGGSEWLLCAMMAKLYQGWSILYSLPTEALRNVYVANRIDPLLQVVPFYKHGLKSGRGESDQVGLKHIWNGTARFIGSNSKVGFVEFPADMVIVDELDTSNIKNLALAPDRLQASKHKYFWQIGNPTIPKYGIHRAYADSDQKQWHIKCSACNERQPLDFFKNVVREVSENQYELIDKDYNIVCRKCGSMLDRLSKGEWVARHSSRDVSGYHISQLFSPTVSAQEIYNQFIAGQFDQTKMQVFYNSCLGLPYHGTGDKLTASMLETRAMADYLMPSSAEGCIAGIDVGKVLNVEISIPHRVILEKERSSKLVNRVVFVGTVSSFDELSNLFNRYKMNLAVIDAAPERHKIAEIQKKHPFLWACQYPSSEIPEFWRVKDDERYFTVDRTQACDAMVASVLQGDEQVPKDFRSIDNGDYVEQLEAPVRILHVPDSKVVSRTQPRYIWDEGGNDDHYFHTRVYRYLAGRILTYKGNSMPSDIITGEGSELSRELEDFCL